VHGFKRGARPGQCVGGRVGAWVEAEPAAGRASRWSAGSLVRLARRAGHLQGHHRGDAVAAVGEVGDRTLARLRDDGRQSGARASMMESSRWVTYKQVSDFYRHGVGESAPGAPSWGVAGVALV